METKTIGYIILDIDSHQPDWDGALHPDYTSAVQSLTGPHQPYSQAFGPEEDTRPPWTRYYLICPVTTNTL